MHTPEQLRAELDAVRRQMADQAAAQEEFLRAVVHDLRAPLRHVTSYGTLVRELLQEIAPAPGQVAEALDFVATMEQSARRMAAMLDGLQAIAHATRAPLAPAGVDLAAAVQGVRMRLADAAAGREVLWDVQLADGLPPCQADPALFGQLLEQLLDNALKFTRGRAPAQIAVHAALCGAGRVAIRVQDNGVGFDDSRAPRLGTPFQRQHRDGEFGGVGVGLALCRVVAQRHDARMEVSARPDAGCCVRLDWPAMTD